MFGYRGTVRTVEPHLYGRLTTGADALSAWMRPGWSRTDPDGEWRMFHVDALEEIQALPERFDGPRPDFNPDDPHFVEIFCTIAPGPEVMIRPARASDAEQWTALRHALWPDVTAAALGEDARRYFEQEEKRPGTMPEQVFVAEDPEGGRLIGFAELSRRLYAEGCETSPVGFLEGWYVAPGYRRRGVGRRLVAAGESWAREVGCTEFASDALVDNALSADAHRALGFDEVEVIRCFRKDLAP